MSKPKGVLEQRKAFIEGSKFLVRAVEKYCNKSEILGIDPARGSTGWCFLKPSKKNWIETGNISPPSEGFSKVIYVEKKIRGFYENISPLVVIEGYAMNARFGRELAGELGGVLRRLFYYKKSPLLVVSPLTIKAWVKAKSKDQIMLEILDRYGVKISNNDAADAFVLAQVGYAATLMAKEIVKSKIEDPEEIRLFLKEERYKKNPGLKNLFRYQESSLFKLIMNQGSKVEFFLKNKPEL